MADLSQSMNCKGEETSNCGLNDTQTPRFFHCLVGKIDYIWRKVVNDCWKEKKKQSILAFSKEMSKSEKQMFIQVF